MSPISHTEEFKKRVVYDVVVKKHSLNRAAMDNGVSPQALSGYVKKYGQEVLDEYNRKNGIGQIVSDTRERMAQKPPQGAPTKENAEGGAGGVERPENSPVDCFQRDASGSDMTGKPPAETSLSPAGDISPFRGEGSRPEGAGEGATGTTGKAARKKPAADEKPNRPRAQRPGIMVTQLADQTAKYTLLNPDAVSVELHEQKNTFTPEELLTWAEGMAIAAKRFGAKSWEDE